jgi:hypothetical protein
MRRHSRSHIETAHDMQDSSPLLALSDGLLVVRCILPYAGAYQIRFIECLYSVNQRIRATTGDCRRSIDDANVAAIARNLRVKGIGLGFDGVDDLLARPAPAGTAQVGDAFVGVVAGLLVNAGNLDVGHWRGAFLFVRNWGRHDRRVL